MPNGDRISLPKNQYDSFKELIEDVGEEQVLEWVNYLAKQVQARNEYHKKYNTARKEFMNDPRVVALKKQIQG